ncbi:MAG: hypothetical protein EHM48_00615 [Planctomycetaceae bacterium]|nr:MAG: hypothetical protein EHM48_00615 [Planctomycetaceae bacterium]
MNGIVNQLLADKRFVIAASIMLVMAVGGQWAISALKFALIKEPVPWPAGVSVNEESRNTSFPKKLGPGNRYALVESDGELARDKDGKADGELIIDNETLKILGMGSSGDKGRIPQRKSNWYLSRVYRDTQAGAGSPYKYYYLSITYFTGGLDTVPHVGERCLSAAGASILSQGSQMVVVPGLPAPWDNDGDKLDFRRLLYNVKRSGGTSSHQIQYYIFSLNGHPESAFEKVRVGLMNPFNKYVYFAKIQIEPYWAVENVDETDQRIQEFIRLSMPTILKTLPMPSDIEKLESAPKD